VIKATPGGRTWRALNIEIFEDFGLFEPPYDERE
jgi:hypothetical protein